VLALLVLVVVVGVLAVIGLLSGDDSAGGGNQAAGTDTTTERTTTQPKKQKKQQAAAPKRVKLRVVPSTPTWVCVDRGTGTTVMFENTIDSPQTFRGRRLRINLGKRDVQIVKNGKQVEVTPGSDAVGFDFTPRRTRELPVGQRPCL
jgi:hypothetical protein